MEWCDETCFGGPSPLGVVLLFGLMVLEYSMES